MKRTENKKAMPAGTGTALNTAHAADSTRAAMHDKITLLETVGPVLTKTYKSDGSVEPYGSPASFKVKSAEVKGWDDLRKLLAGLHKNPKRCLVRGKFVGADKAEPGNVEGTFARVNANFDDQPLHWFMADVDGFEPAFADPVKQPELAITEYIEAVLPPSFLKASYYWHLSSSAGMPGKEHILKAHIHFISKTPYTTAQMASWAKMIGPQIDSAIYRRVQVHYTADPIFKPGRVDPVAVRAGFHQGTEDFVDLVLGESVLSSARDLGAGTGGNDMKLVDPSEKDNIIGLFHRTYTAEDVLLTMLEGEFEQISERRYTWHHGGGTPEGVWVHDDGLHVGSSHNTWPIDGIANLWDLVRVFKFGDLDVSSDEFEQLDIDSREIQAKPSNLAMVAFANGLEELNVTKREERDADLNYLTKRIADAKDAFELETIVAKDIREAKLLVTDRTFLKTAFNARLDTFGRKLRAGPLDALLNPPRTLTVLPGAPSWMQAWVWSSDDNAFFNTETKELVSERSFNAMYDRNISADDRGNQPRAADVALRVCDMMVVSRLMYAPTETKSTFNYQGRPVANTYQTSQIPDVPQRFDSEQRKAIRIVEDHAKLLLPDDLERTLFLDYLAFCVKYPGTKIRWAPLLKGVEGDGKSAFVTMMQNVMGPTNVRVLDSATLESSDFTGWRVGQCFTGVEEMKLHGHNRFDVYNKLKTPLSNTTVEVHFKGKDPVTLPNTTNYLLLTNYEDGMPIGDNDRRLMVLRTPFLTTADLMAQIHSTYFDDLFDFAINGHAGALRKWLYERELSAAFNPNGQAPRTKARELAVAVSRRDDEDAIDVILADSAFGVYPELVSVSCLNDALTGLGIKRLVTGQSKAALVSRGFTPLVTSGKNQTKWGGKNHVFYFRGDRPRQPAALAETLEKDRQSKIVDEGFAD